MTFTYFLLQLPPLLLLFIIVIVFAGGGVLSTWLFRRYVKLSYRRSHNEVIGYIFAILGGFYGLLLGFVVFLVWDADNNAQNNADHEGSVARALYRSIKYYPDQAEMQPLHTSYVNFVHGVVEGEYPAMEHLEPIGLQHRENFNDVFIQMEKLDAHDPKIEQMFRHLNELATYRSLRLLNASSEITIEIWVPLILGGTVILMFAMLVDVESKWLHILVNGLLGAFIGMVIYMIVILDHPFTGKLRIEPTEYKTILQMEKEDPFAK